MQAIATSSKTSFQALPAVMPEQQLSSFNFYREDDIHEGIWHEGNVYSLNQEFSVRSRLAAYQFAYELAEQGAAVLITISTSRYAVWVGLRAAACQAT